MTEKKQGMLKRFLPFLGKFKKYAILSVICVFVESIFELLIPLVMADIVDVGIKLGDKAFTIKSGIYMIVLALGSLITGVGASFFSARASRGFGANLRKAEFDKIQEFSFSNLDKFSTSGLITRLTNDVNRLQMTVGMCVRMLFRAPIMFLSALVLAVYMNPRLAMVFVIAIPILSIFVYRHMTTVAPLFGKMQEKIDRLNNVVQENLIAIRVVKAYVRHDYEIEKFDYVNTDLKNMSVSIFNKMIVLFPVMQIIVQSTLIAVMWIGGNMVQAGTFDVGKLSSFLSYVMQILMSIMMMSMVLMNLTRAIASGERVLEVLDTVPDINDGHADMDLKVETGDIVFEHVNFRYDLKAPKNVLSDINLNIKSGQTIGLIGGTGSAKSTLVQLIPRLYEVSEGSLFISGHDIKEYPLEELRNNVSMVLQNNTLFSGSIKDNLRWGDENASDEDIIKACKSAAAHDFIMNFPDGYDTDLGQGGVNVSGGQKQRLCIARAILKKPKVLILDDSTSAVDTATEAVIRQAFRTDLKDTTKIIIAQRITSVMDADQIIILDDGKIVDIGNHDELMARGGIYHDIYVSQQEGADFDE